MEYYGWTKEEWDAMSNEQKQAYADHHTCGDNAEYICFGSAGPGYYCTECGALVDSDDAIAHRKESLFPNDE